MGYGNWWNRVDAFLLAKCRSIIASVISKEFKEDDDSRFLSFAKLTFFLFINFFVDVVSLMTRVDSMFRSAGTSSVQWNLKMFLNLFWISHLSMFQTTSSIMIKLLEYLLSREKKFPTKLSVFFIL